MGRRGRKKCIFLGKDAGDGAGGMGVGGGLGEKEKRRKSILFEHRRIIGDPSKMVHTQSWAVLLLFCLFPFFSVCNRFPTPVHTDVHTGIVLSDTPAAARRLGSRIEAALMYHKQTITMARKQSFVITYCGFTQARCKLTVFYPSQL